MSAAPRPWRSAAAFLILFTLYQAAEGIGGRWLGSFAVQAGFMIACLLAAWPVGRYLLGCRGWDAYALERRHGAARWLVGGLMLAALAKGASLAIGLWLGVYAASPAAMPQGAALAGGMALALLSTFVPSIAEDIVTRGFWWRRPWMPRGIAFVAISSLIYTLNHIYRLQNGPGEWLMLLSFGIAYGAALVRSGSLWGAVGLHWGWNLANALIGSFAAVESLSPSAPLLSAAAHLVMAAIVWFSPVPATSAASRLSPRGSRGPGHCGQARSGSAAG